MMKIPDNIPNLKEIGIYYYTTHGIINKILKELTKMNELIDSDRAEKLNICWFYIIRWFNSHINFVLKPDIDFKKYEIEMFDEMYNKTLMSYIKEMEKEIGIEYNNVFLLLLEEFKEDLKAYIEYDTDKFTYIKNIGELLYIYCLNFIFSLIEIDYNIDKKHFYIFINILYEKPDFIYKKMQLYNIKEGDSLFLDFIYYRKHLNQLQPMLDKLEKKYKIKIINVEV